MLTCSPTSWSRCFCLLLVQILCTWSVYWVLRLVLLCWKLPLGGTSPVPHIEIPPVLSEEWNNRHRKQPSQPLSLKLAERHDHPVTVGQGSRQNGNNREQECLQWTAMVAVQEKGPIVVSIWVWIEDPPCFKE